MSQATPRKISKETENKLVGYLDKVAQHINDGSTPNEAIVKVARSHDIELGHVRLIAQAYNNARTNQQRKSSDTMHEKIASFQLADIKTIAHELYPKQIKTAAVREREEGVSEEYKYAPRLKLDVNPKFERFTKIASVTTAAPLAKEPTRHIKKAFSLLKELDHSFDENRRLVNSSRDKVAQAYNDLLYYFKQAYHPVRYKEATAGAVALWGKPAQVLMDHIAQDLPQLNKEASSVCRAVDIRKEPYTIIGACLDSIKKHASYKKDFQEFSKAAEEASLQLVAPFLPVPIQRTYGSIVKKAEGGSGLDPISTGTAGLLATKPVTSALEKSLGKPDNKLKTDAFTAVSDPQHETKIRALKAQSMLTDMMANDPFLSGEQPERVVGLYNQITKLSPRAADQPLLMRALLRRYLAQGQVDPHDIDQLAGIEVKLKQRDEPQREYNLPKLPQDFTQGGGAAPHGGE